MLRDNLFRLYINYDYSYEMHLKYIFVFYEQKISVILIEYIYINIPLDAFIFS